MLIELTGAETGGSVPFVGHKQGEDRPGGERNEQRRHGSVLDAAPPALHGIVPSVFQGLRRAVDLSFRPASQIRHDSSYSVARSHNHILTARSGPAQQSDHIFAQATDVAL